MNHNKHRNNLNLLINSRRKRGIYKETKKNKLETTSHITSIFSAIASTILAGIAIHLTIKYGENKDHIIRLDQLAQKQQVQIDTLVDVLKELKIQNQLTQDQNVEVRNQGKEIYNQSTNIAKQLGISQVEFVASNKFKRLERKASFNLLKKTFTEIQDLAPDQGEYFFKSYKKDQQIQYFIKLKPLLEKELYNLVLLENDKAFQKWSSLYSETRYILHLLDIPYESIAFLKEEHGKIVRENNLGEIEKSLQEVFSKFVDKYYDFFWYILKNMIYEEKSYLY